MSLSERWPDLLTVQEAAEILRADPAAVESYISGGEIKHAEIAGKTLIPKRFLEEFIAKSCKVCYNEGVEIDPSHLDNRIELDYTPLKGEFEMAKITRTITFNGVKHWIRASTGAGIR